MIKKLTLVDKNSATFGWRRSMRWRLMITLGVVIVITLLGISLGVFTYIRQSEGRFWQDRQHEATGLAADVVSEFLERQLQGLVLLGSFDADALTPQAIDNLIQQSPDLLEIVRLDENGSILASGYQDEPLMANLFTVPQSDWFLESRAGRQYLGEIELSSANQPYLIISVPASDNGVAVARLSADVLWQVVSELQPGETGQAYLVNQDGLIVAHTNKDYVERYTSLKDKPNFASLMEALNSEWRGSYVNPDGEQVEGTTSPIEGSQWTVVTEIARAESTATSQTALTILGSGIVFLGLLLIVLTSVVLERTIIRPLQQLRSGAERVGQGDVQYRIEMTQRDELGQVAAAFNHMAAEIQDGYDTLEDRVAERTQRLELVAALSERLTAILDVDQLLLELVNQVKQALDYYHVHVYLLDRQQEELIVAAGTGEAGAETTAKGHNIPLDAPTSLVARAARRGEIVSVDNVREAPDWRPNPLLPDTYAEMAVPVMLEGTVVGVLDVHENEIGGLDEADANLLRSLANQVAVAIHNARLYGALQAAHDDLELRVHQRTAELVKANKQLHQEVGERRQAEEELQQSYQAQSLLNELLQISLENTPLEALLEQALDIMTSIPGFPALPKGGIFLVEPDSKRLALKVQRNLDPHLHTMCALVPFGHCLCGRAAASGQIQFADCVDERHEISYEGMTPHGHYNVPIRADDGRVLGVVVLYLEHGHQRDEQEVAILEGLTGILAGLIQRKQAADLLAKRAAELETVAEVSATAATILDPTVLLQEVVDLTKARFELYHAHIYLLQLGEEQGGVLTLAAGAGEVGRQMVAQGWEIPLDREQSLVAQAARTRQGVIVGDVRQDPNFLPNKLLPETRSEMAVPLIVGDKVLGVLDVQSQRVNHFSAEDVNIQTTLAGQIAGALENARLFAAVQRSTADLAAHGQELEKQRRELEKRTGELEASQQVTFAASETSDPGELLGIVVDLIRDQFDLYHAQVYVVDEKQQAAVLRESTGYAGQQLLVQRHHLPLASPAPVTRAISQGQPLLLADVSQAKDWRPNELLPHTQAELVVPLKVGRRMLGVLDVHSRSTEQLNQRSIALFQTMADQIAFLFENSDLLSRVSEQTEALSHVTLQLRTATEIAEHLNTILDPDQLLDEAVELMQRRFGLYHAHVYLLDTPATPSVNGEEPEEVLIVRAGSGDVGRTLCEQGHHIPLDREQSLVARAARSRQAVVVANVKNEPGFFLNPLLPQTQSEVAIPLIFGQRLLGVLDIQDDQPGRFGEAEVDTFTTLAGQMATALQNARLYEESQQTAQRLREVDRVKGEFLANMSHELRTPLNSIIGYSEMMLMGMNGELTQEMAHDVQAIYDNGHHLLHLIGDILDLAKIEAGRMNLNFQEVPLDDLLETVKFNNEGLFMNKPTELLIEVEPGLPAIEADPVRLKQILNNLVSNAAKFTPEGEVALRAFRENGWVCLEVEDSGVGISPEDLGTIFEKFQQVDDSFTKRAEGTGLGLAITRHLTHMHGGDIDVRSKLGEGTTFSVRLPLERPQEDVGKDEEAVAEMAMAASTNGVKAQ